MRLPILAAALVVSAPAFAQESQDAALEQAARRGTLIYAYDQAAWHGTDDLIARRKGDLSDVGGWIVDGPAGSPELVFYDKDAADPHAVYVAQFTRGKLVSAHVVAAGEKAGLSPARKQMITALAAARAALAKSGAQPCVDKPFNTVVLPGATPDAPTLVYFLTPQTKNGTLPMGGHYLFPVAADGTPGPMRRFMKTCMELPTAPPAGQGKNPLAVTITHLLDSTPTEIHVFSALRMRIPLIVMTGQTMWAVEGNRIRSVPTR